MAARRGSAELVRLARPDTTLGCGAGCGLRIAAVQGPQGDRDDLVGGLLATDGRGLAGDVEEPVSVAPGDRASTRRPVPLASTHNASVKLSTMALVAPYTVPR